MPTLIRLALAPLFAATMFSTGMAQDSGRTLFDFSNPNAASQWQIVNDGVMGGRSSSRAEMAGENRMRFSGNLSLANNGGFASVRSLPQSLGLNPGDSIVLRVRGDGRQYTLNLYPPGRRTAFSYRVDFTTKAGQWTDVRIPMDRFVATSFGRRVGGSLDPRQIRSVGILLGDKKPGRFEIMIDSIKVEPAR